MASGTINGTTSLHSGDYTFWIAWSSEKNTIQNKSTVTATAYVKSNGSYASDTVNSQWRQEITINGNTASKNIRVNIPSGGTITLISHTVTVDHNGDGTKSITISSTCKLGSASYSPGTGTASKSVTLDSIDRTAPTITLQEGSVTTSSITVTAKGNTTCDEWWYSTNNGSTWTKYSDLTGVQASKTISGLSPSTTYSLKARARKKSNQVYGVSQPLSVRTKDAVPGAPTACTAKVGNDSVNYSVGDTITIAWSGATGTVTGYEIQYAFTSPGSTAWSSWTAWTTATGTSVTDQSSRLAGVQIKYRVRALNGSYASAWKESNALTVRGGMRFNAGGTWKHGTVWINVAGVWKRARCVWRNVGGTWKRSI